MKSQVWIGKKRLKKPLIQGGMGVGISLGRLAGSVAKAGGVRTGGGSGEGRGSRNHFGRADRLFTA